MKDVYVVSCCRTAIGSFGGTLKDVSAPALGGVALKEAVSRAGVDVNAIDEVLFGCVYTAGLGQNVARQVAMQAGVPVEVPASTVGMVCGSGMRSVLDGIRAIRAGDADIIAAGGTENMSSVPYLSQKVRWGGRMGHFDMIDGMIHDGLWDIYNDYHMGVTAENLCDQYGLTREELDTYAMLSQKKAAEAIAAGKFKEEIVPVEIKSKKETILFTEDEYPREVTLEKLAKLRPAFKQDGMVTAGNASGINDGAAALILASKEAVDKYGLKPMAKIVGWGQAGVDPSVMGIGPVPASKKALEMAGLTVDELDLIEGNEAFAAQSLAVARELGFEEEMVNVNGGAIALGHPIGASGARIIVTLLHEMQKRKAKYGLATLCIGGGMGIATVFEKVKKTQ